MGEWRERLTEKGFEVYVPGGIQDIENYKESGSTGEAIKRKIDNDYINAHYKYIKQSEAVLILNYDKDGVENYIGGNSLLEMGFAFTLNRDIFLLNAIPDMPYTSEIAAMQPIVIDQDIEKIVSYFNSLPKAVLSSESPIKLKATTLALREYDMRYQVIGYKTDSGVKDQPTSVEEVYKGAKNRLDDLKVQAAEIKPDLFISIESGISKIIDERNYIGLSVCFIENDEKQVMATLTDLEFPREMTDLVPSVYPDIGILMQEKYGLKYKDPFIYMTNGKLNREKLMFDVVVNTLACL